MNADWNIIGHQEIVGYLDQSIKHSKLAQTYLFHGIRGLGKTTLALRFAQKLAGTDEQLKHNLFELDLGSESREIKIDQVREWQRFLSLKAIGDGYKMGIIHQAENLNNESANALLKTIEEPPANTIIILLTSSRQNLLSTIVSRSQTIHFLPVPSSIIAKAIESHFKKINERQLIVELAMGRPGLALKLSLDNDFRQAYLALHERIANLYKLPLVERWNFLEQFLSGETYENYDLARAIIDHLEVICHQEISRGETNFQNLNRFCKIFDLINQAKFSLEYNTQPKVIMENLMINL